MNIYIVMSEGDCVYVGTNKAVCISKAEKMQYDYVELWKNSRYEGRIWSNERTEKE